MAFSAAKMHMIVMRLYIGMHEVTMADIVSIIVAPCAYYTQWHDHVLIKFHPVLYSDRNHKMYL